MLLNANAVKFYGYGVVSEEGDHFVEVFSVYGVYPVWREDLTQREQHEQAQGYAYMRDMEFF